MKPLTVPWTDVNSDSAQLVAWHVEDRSRVEESASLADVETSKALLEIEAPAAGHLLQLVEAGQQVRVGEPIGYVFDDEESLESYVEHAQASEPARPPARDAVRATDKARERARELGVDLVSLSAGGLITARDVEQAAGSPATAGEAVPREPLAGDPVRQRLLLIGAGLGATQVADILAETPRQQAVAIVDDNPELWGRVIRGLPVVGGSDRIGELYAGNAFDAAVITISTSVSARSRLRSLCEGLGIPLANVIDSRAKVATGVVMGTGNVICAFVHFGTETRIGDNNFISAFNSFDHHNVLGSDISTGPGCLTSGEVQIGDRARLGTGIFIEPKVSLGEGVAVASGAIIVRSVPDGHAVKTKVVTTTVVPPRGA